MGETSLAFNPHNKRYFELTPHEKDIFLESEGNIKNLIESRINKYGAVEPMLGKKAEPVGSASSESESCSDS